MPSIRRYLAPFVLLAVLASGRSYAASKAVEARLKKDITYLASAECEGRGVSTQGINLAAEYIVNEFKQAGLKPGGTEGTYFQPFTIRGVNKLGSPNHLRLYGPSGQEIALLIDRHFSVAGLSGAGKASAPIVFAGYGATARNIKYDDFAGINVKGKIVLLLRRAPRANNSRTPFDGNMSAFHSGLSAKIANAAKHGAAAVLVVNDRGTAGTTDALMTFDYLAYDTGADVPVLHIHRKTAEVMIRSTFGRSLGELEEEIDHDLKPQSALLSGWSADLQASTSRPGTPCKNIIGVVEGAGKLAHEIVVVGAHYDHLGYGGAGSMAGRLAKPAIHHGADDNGSGTTALLELARRFAKRGDSENRRKLLFMAFSAEESGLLGSKHYVNHPLFPLADTVAMVNLDMVGRLRPHSETNQDRLMIEGSGSGKNIDQLLASLNKKYDFHMTKQASGYGPSDHASFYDKNIPVIFYWTGTHSDYHRPSDTADKINITGMAKIVDLAEDTVQYFITAPERTPYIRVKEARSQRRMAGGGPRLGIQPAYGDEGEGVLLEGVSPGQPAEASGLKAGDRIVEMAGKPVKDIETYMAIMQGQKAGDSLEVGILRSGKRLMVKVKLN